MNNYETSTRGVIFGIGAVAMTALTLAVFVLLPAEIRAYEDPTSTLSGIVTAAAAGLDAGAVGGKTHSVGTPVSASVRRTPVQRDRVQEL